MNAAAIRRASNPRTACRMSGARTAASMAGCVHANIRESRRSGTSPLRDLSDRRSRSAATPHGRGPPRAMPRGINQAVPRRREQPRVGGAGHAGDGHRDSAAANASANASSAADIVGSHGEQRQQLAVALPRGAFGGAPRGRLLVRTWNGFGHEGMVRIGRLRPSRVPCQGIGGPFDGSVESGASIM